MNIKKKILESNFLPKLPWSLVNPFYINRRLLAESISRHSSHINGTVLDYGCGSKPYRSFFSFTRYIGVDIDNPSHPHSNEEVDVFYDGKKIPFDDCHFDSCFSSEVLEHVFEIDGAISEIRRVLKPEGKVLITTPFIWDEHEAPYDNCRYTSFGIKKAFERNGFKIMSSEKTGSFRAVIIQLILIKLHRIAETNRIFKYPFFILICPILNLMSLGSFKIDDKKTIYLGNVVLAQKTR